jgi:hypothetical protein
LETNKMSKLVDGVWVHRIWCNYAMTQGPCWCCDSHKEWPYPDELLAKYPGMSLEEAADAEVAKKWPYAIKIR